MDPAFSKSLEFSDAEHILRTLEFVEDEPRSLHLQGGSVDSEMPIESLRLHDDSRELTLNPGPDGWPEQLRSAEAFTLIASDGNESLEFTELSCLTAPPTSDSENAWRFSLPKRLIVVNKRDGVRLPFVKGMYARFRLLSETACELAVGRIVDLSIGGCQIELPIGSALLLDVEGPPATVEFTFPSGARLTCRARFRYVRIPRAGAFARAGVAFGELHEEQQQTLWLWLREIEGELAVRRGQRKVSRRGDGLFVAAKDSMLAASRPVRPRPRHGRRTQSMRSGLIEVARQLASAALAIRSDQPLIEDKLHYSADRMIRLLTRDRPTFLYALCCLSDQPPLIQHSLSVAGRLADLVDADASVTADRHAVVVGALLHDLGQVRLLDPQRPSLDGVRRLPAGQLAAGSRHVLSILDAQPGLDHEHTRCIISAIQAQSQAVPTGTASQTVVAQAARVVDAVDARTRGYHGERPIAAFQAYRQLYEEEQRFAPYWVRRYVQRQGPYPIGSVVRYANGFRAQVVALDPRGNPERVRVLRNLAASGQQRLNIVLSGVDLLQLGPLERPLPFEADELYCRPGPE